jgi:hypothetical protein
MRTPVPCYGLHQEKNIWWLVQGRGSSNFLGLKDDVPFEGPKRACNHLIPAAAPVPDRIQWERFLEYFNDPLVQAMLPLPGKRGVFLTDPEDTLGLLLITLSRLSSPITSIVKPAWMLTEGVLKREQQASNIQPLVLIQCTPKQQRLVDQIASGINYQPRPMVLTGDENVIISAPMERITTRIKQLDDLMTLPLENIGAFILRRYARRDPLDAPLVRK